MLVTEFAVHLMLPSSRRMLRSSSCPYRNQRAFDFATRAGAGEAQWFWRVQVHFFLVAPETKLDVLLPLVANTIDERLERTVRLRERWFEFLLGAAPRIDEYGLAADDSMQLAAGGVRQGAADRSRAPRSRLGSASSPRLGDSLLSSGHQTDHDAVRRPP